MLFSPKKLLSAALTLAAFPLSAQAQSFSDKDVVVDTNQNYIRNTFGNCVRTKWTSEQDKCGTVAPAAPTPQAPPRAEAPRSRSYLVFFDWDKDILTTDSQAILNDAFNNASREGTSTFDVIGHADRSGPDAYNLGLSQRRAAKVKNYLQDQGAKSVTAAAKGESVPLVPTEDGVREPQNRRVEIFYVTP